MPDGQKYTVGDHLGVYGFNPTAVTSAYLKRINIEPDTVVKINGGNDEGFAP